VGDIGNTAWGVRAEIYGDEVSSAESVNPLGIRRPLREAALLAAVAAVTTMGTIGASFRQSNNQSLDALAFALLLIAPALLVFRHRWPVPTVVAVLAVLVTYYGLRYPYGPAFLSLIIALFAAVGTGYRLAAWVLGSVGMAAYFAVDWSVFGEPPTLPSIAGHVAWLLVVLMLAELVRIRRFRAAEARRMREETERRQVSEERLRIARELHDILGHSISLINVQASVGLHLMDKEPDRARNALLAIKKASGETLTEVQAAIKALRKEDADERPAPAPGLVRVDELISQFAAAGLRVMLTSSGQRRPIGASVDLAAFRIVQEALTNVLRHARSTAAEVVLDYGQDTLTLTVTDDGIGVADQVVGGRGIIGMRERAALAGGHLSAGPDPDGGFRVTAVLPLLGGGT
jgi:signal transduction histidine kinase